MKKSSKIRSFKALVLGQLLLGSLCVSARADWNHGALAKAEERFFEQGYPNGVIAMQAIDRYTLTALLIIDETQQRIDASGARARDLAELRGQLKAITQAAMDIRNRTDKMLTTLDTETDPASIGLVSGALEKEIPAARTNFTAALDISHQIQKIIDTRPPCRPACCW
jgi:hypothetical protein